MMRPPPPTASVLQPDSIIKPDLPLSFLLLCLITIPSEATRSPPPGRRSSPPAISSPTTSRPPSTTPLPAVPPLYGQNHQAEPTTSLSFSPSEAAKTDPNSSPLHQIRPNFNLLAAGHIPNSGPSPGRSPSTPAISPLQSPDNFPGLQPGRNQVLSFSSQISRPPLSANTTIINQQPRIPQGSPNPLRLSISPQPRSAAI